jgi:cell division protein FtsL
MSDKSKLLEEIGRDLEREFDIDFRSLIKVLLIITLVLLILFPKIYLQSQIYYKSKDIAQLKREYESLKEENSVIKAKVEEKQFKNQILDTIF